MSSTCNRFIPKIDKDHLRKHSLLTKNPIEINCSIRLSYEATANRQHQNLKRITPRSLVGGLKIAPEMKPSLNEVGYKLMPT